MKKIDYCSRIVINRKKQKREKIALLVSLVLLFTIAVGGTIAFIYTKTDGVKNTFNPSKVTCSIEEKFIDEKTKKEVSITNTGDTEAYIRARIVVNWIDDKGNISAISPELGKDYSLDDYKDEKWIKIGEYYYYKYPVEVDKSTSFLINECKQITENEGYFLSVEILAEAIQSTPSKAVEESWNVQVNSNEIITGKGGQ